MLEFATATKKEKSKLRNHNHCFDDRHHSESRTVEKRQLKIQSLPLSLQENSDIPREKIVGMSPV